MDKVIVAFESEKTLDQMRGILEREGIAVAAACTGGSQALRAARKYDGGVLLCGFKLRDMAAVELYHDIPPGYTLLVLANQAKLDQINEENIVKLSAPVQKKELIASVQMLLQTGAQREKPNVPKRSEEEKELIWKAKFLLMERQHMTEEQAHRFIQKRSMDAGYKMVQTAQIILGESY
jgi:response regulator NasT